jgi:hypothetical protein
MFFALLRFASAGIRLICVGEYVGTEFNECCHATPNRTPVSFGSKQVGEAERRLL